MENKETNSLQGHRADFHTVQNSVTVFEMGLSLPWHEPVLAKAVRTVYQRNAVIFQYNRSEAERPLTQTSLSSCEPSVLSLSGGPTLVLALPPSRAPSLPHTHTHSLTHSLGGEDKRERERERSFLTIKKFLLTNIVDWLLSPASSSR